MSSVSRQCSGHSLNVIKKEILRALFQKWHNKFNDRFFSSVRKFYNEGSEWLLSSAIRVEKSCWLIRTSSVVQWSGIIYTMMILFIWIKRFYTWRLLSNVWSASLKTWRIARAAESALIVNIYDQNQSIKQYTLHLYTVHFDFSSFSSLYPFRSIFSTVISDTRHGASNLYLQLVHRTVLWMDSWVRCRDLVSERARKENQVHANEREKKIMCTRENRIIMRVIFVFSHLGCDRPIVWESAIEI